MKAILDELEKEAVRNGLDALDSLILQAQNERRCLEQTRGFSIHTQDLLGLVARILSLRVRVVSMQTVRALQENAAFFKANTARVTRANAARAKAKAKAKIPVRKKKP